MHRNYYYTEKIDKQRIDIPGDNISDSLDSSSEFPEPENQWPGPLI